MRRKLTDEDLQAAQRLKSIWSVRGKALGLTQEKAADAMGFNTQGAVSHYINGQTPLNTDAVIKFASLLQVSPEDIRPELAPLLNLVRKGPSPTTGFSNDDQERLTAQQRELLALFDKLPESEKVNLIGQLEAKTQDYERLLNELLELRKQNRV